MSTSVWDYVLERTLKAEGGANNDPIDRGGRTAPGGITEPCLSNAIQHHDVPYTLQLVDVTRQDAALIYRGIWNRLRCGDLHPAVALVVFDAAVLQGEHRAARWLQETLNAQGRQVATDGVIGFRTVSAAQATPPAQLVSLLMATRRAAIDALIEARPEQVKFKHGWENRLHALEQDALAFLQGVKR
jgi:lysozyme family protein